MGGLLMFVYGNGKWHIVLRSDEIMRARRLYTTYCGYGYSDYFSTSRDGLLRESRCFCSRCFAEMCREADQGSPSSAEMNERSTPECLGGPH
jgi:hypothetical protein